MTGQASRYEWIDIAKGFSIVLVVLLHTATWFSNVIFREQMFWLYTSQYVSAIRMPLFFSISGLLFSSSLRKDFLATWPKTIGLFLFYAGWTLCWSIKDSDGSALGMIANAFWAVLLPTYFWYIWALPLFCAICWLFNRYFPGRFPLLLLASLALSICSTWVPDDVGDRLGLPFQVMLFSVATNFFWFCCGLHFWERIIDTVARASVGKALLGVLVYVPLVAITVHYGFLTKLKWLVAPAALWAALQISGLINTRSMVSRFLGHVGRLTLPVYIFHLIGISILSVLFGKLGLDPVIRSYGPWSELALVPLLALAMVVGSRLAGQLLEASPLWFLVRPMPLPRALARDHPPTGIMKEASR